MKANPRFLLTLASMVWLTACEYSRTEMSNEMTEPATVADLVHTPANHGIAVSPTIDFSANLGLSITSVDVPQKYAVVFECKHGKFIIENDQEKTEALWKTLKWNQKVTVRYREVYRVVYVDKKPAERHLVKYDFLDAVPIKETAELPESPNR